MPSIVERAVEGGRPRDPPTKPSRGWLRVVVRKPRLVLFEYRATRNKVTAKPRSYCRGCNFGVMGHLASFLCLSPILQSATTKKAATSMTRPRASDRGDARLWRAPGACAHSALVRVPCSARDNTNTRTSTRRERRAHGRAARATVSAPPATLDAREARNFIVLIVRVSVTHVAVAAVVAAEPEHAREREGHERGGRRAAPDEQGGR